MRGGGKIKGLLPVHCSGSSAHLCSQVLTDVSDVKRTIKNMIHALFVQKLSPQLLPDGTPTVAHTQRCH